MLLVGLLAGCSGRLELGKTTSQKWHGGAAGSGGGTNYRVELKKPKKSRLEIERVWLGDTQKGWMPTFAFEAPAVSEDNAHIAKEGHGNCILKFTETYLGQIDEDRAKPEERIVAAPSDLPEGFEKGIVIWYKHNETKGQWVITSVEQLEPLYYP